MPFAPAIKLVRPTVGRASYRVTGNAVAMGDAAGQVAAVAALTGRVPSEVRRDEIAGADRPNASHT